MTLTLTGVASSSITGATGSEVERGTPDKTGVGGAAGKEGDDDFWKRSRLSNFSFAKMHMHHMSMRYLPF